MYKQHNIVMLPTNEASIIVKNTMSIHIQSESKLYLRQEPELVNPKSKSTANQHLYILSDDEIKEGDWYHNSIDNSIKQASDWIYVSTCKKIIATTDTSLILHDNSKNNKCFGTQLSGKCSHILPQIPTSFIQYFIEQYNNGNVITKVNVEYVIWTQDIKTGKFSLFINPFNCINIKTVKDSYSRDEVIAFAKAYAEAVWNIRHDNGSAFFDTLERKWIEQNL